MAFYIDSNKKISSMFINVNSEKKNVVSAWVDRDGVPAKVFGMAKDSTIQITANSYIAKSRGQSFTLVVPDEEEIVCTMTDNDQILLDENTVTVAENSTIGTITPVTVKSNGKTYTIRVITAPDVSRNSYEIYNSNDLVALRTIVAYSAINDVNLNAKLMNDIDLSDVCSSTLGNWSGIGGTSKRYSGVFDGQNHSINNLYMNMSYTSTSTSTISLYYGLFSWTKDATIKNMTINGTVQANSSTANYMYVGGICGYSTNTLFENITNNCTVTLSYTNNSAYTGGICGYGGTFVGCTNNGNISGKGYMGGICGYSGSFTDCHNIGNVTSSSSSAGGICSFGGSTSNCSNAGTVRGSRGVTGGILGKNSGNIEHCYNTGTVSSSSMTGGIIGHLVGNHVYESYNTGNVTASNTNSGHAGGIAGSTSGSIKDCYNKGTISAYLSAGGIIGWSQWGGIVCQNCYDIGQYKYTGPTSGTEYGSIAGYSSAGGGSINNCYALNSRFSNSTITKTDCEVFDTTALSSYVEKLGDAYTDDIEGINDGYPILKFQVE